VELTRPVLEDAALRHAFDQMFCHWNAAPTADEKSILEELLTRACGLMVRRYSSKPLAAEQMTSLVQVRECLLDQLDCPPTLAALAAMAGLSRYQLVRQFSKAHGLPPFAWLQQHRVGRAQALIANGASLLDAALTSGFSDQSHLTRAFGRYRGFTPGAWQRAQ
jgi:AraC-like DNA-binding protein